MISKHFCIACKRRLLCFSVSFHCHIYCAIFYIFYDFPNFHIYLCHLFISINFLFSLFIPATCPGEKIVVKRKKSKWASKEIIFDSSKFSLKYVLGTGSFGVVTLAEYSDEITGVTTNYALKSLSKAAVVDTGECGDDIILLSIQLHFTLFFEINSYYFFFHFLGQLRHVMDERKLLSRMNSRFVLKLFGTFHSCLTLA